jgi:hypothetical protein
MDNNKLKIIEKFYEDSNFAGLEKLYTIISQRHKNITKSEIKDYLNSLEEEQIFKPQPVVRPKQGKIVALAPNETWQMDLLDVSKYASQNRNYNFILLVIDVFTRKAYAKGLKKKDNLEVSSAFLNILNQAEGKTPQTITTDNESAFLSHDFETILDIDHILLDPNVKGDNNALGIIDFFCRRLRLVISKTSVRTGNKYNWIDSLEKFVSNYNNSPNTALEDITPNEAEQPENVNIIFEKKLLKSRDNNQITDLVIGDTVRLRIATKFTKASEPQFSDEIYKVIKINGSNIELDNNKVVKRVNLLKVVHTSKPVLTNIYKEAHIQKKAKQIQKKEDIIEENIITTGRERKKKIMHDA